MQFTARRLPRFTPRSICTPWCENQFSHQYRLKTAATLGCFLLTAVGACAPAAKVSIAPLNLKKVRANGPLIVNFKPTACYWWVNDEQQLCIAMGLSKLTFTSWSLDKDKFALSLVFDGLPAGDARMYLLSRRTIRGKRDVGVLHTRFASVTGVAAVWGFGRKTQSTIQSTTQSTIQSTRMTGRFRFVGVQQSFFVLTGWGTPRQIFCVGEFTANFNREKGEAILAQTEEGAMARESADALPEPIFPKSRLTSSSLALVRE